MARHSKLTPAVRDAIIAGLDRGAYFEDACRAAGVGISTGHRWKAHAEDDEPQIADFPNPAAYGWALRHWRACREFRDGIEGAQAGARLLALDVIRKAATEGNWNAAAWYLERTDPAHYARRIEQRHAGADGGPLQVELGEARDKLADMLSRLTDDEDEDGEVIDPATNGGTHA